MCCIIAELFAMDFLIYSFKIISNSFYGRFYFMPWLLLLLLFSDLLILFPSFRFILFYHGNDDLLNGKLFVNNKQFATKYITNRL